MASVAELKNLALEEAKIIIDEMIDKLEPDRQQIARKEIALYPDMHPYSKKMLQKSRMKKVEIQSGKSCLKRNFKITDDQNKEVNNNEELVANSTEINQG